MASFAENHGSTPPVPPPKGSNSHDVSSISTPTTGSSPPPPPLPRMPADTALPTPPVVPDPIPDPGEQWLPEILRDKTTADLAEILRTPRLLHALAQASASSHDSTKASHAGLAASLEHNSAMASQLAQAEQRLAQQREATQAQLLSTHALERQWRARQSDMDHALAPFSPASLYQRLGQGAAEQALVCQAMEESFLDGDAVASEKDVADWIRRYRDAKVLLYQRQERKERWDEGRVGGWR